MRKLNSVISLIIAFITATLFGGCFGFNLNDGEERGQPSLEVYVQISNSNGADTDWFYQMVNEFEELNSQKSYNNYTKGVNFVIYEVDALEIQSINRSFIHMFVSDSGYTTSVKDFADQGRLVDLEDIVYKKIDVRRENGQNVSYSIDDKIEPSYKSALQGSDGKYYALPCSGVRQGITYDINRFNELGLYFADPLTANDQNSIEHVSKFGTARFILPEADQTIEGEGIPTTQIQCKKACGNDGLYGTWDDGTPTSLQELFILCDYMKRVMSVSPFTYDASNPRAKEYVYNALFASLAGSIDYQTTYTMDGEIEIVTGITEQNAFDGIDYIKAPKTERVKITEENGYLANSNVNRYWAMSALRVFEKEGWYSSVSIDKSNSRQKTVTKFLLNGMQVNGEHIPKQAMLLETDRWYVEYKKAGVIRDAKTYLSDGDFSLGWMSMPTLVHGGVTANQNGVANPYFEYQSSAESIMLNAVYKNDLDVMKACKEFLEYVYKDVNLSYYTGQTYQYRSGMNYQVSSSDYYRADEFQNQLLQSYNMVKNRVAPVITKLYNYDVDYFYNPYMNEGYYLGEAMTEFAYWSLYEMFEKSCTDLEEWEILKSGGKFEYIPIDPEPTDPPEDSWEDWYPEEDPDL